MREILFRGISTTHGCFEFGDLITSFGRTYIGNTVGNNPDDLCEVIPESVGQFTSKEDAQIDGTSVFDGDIIQNCDTKDLQIVYWNEDKASWYCRYVNDKNRIVSLSDSIGNLNKVIGNVHENPELCQP